MWFYFLILVKRNLGVQIRMKIHLIIFIVMQFLFFNTKSSAQNTLDINRKVEGSVLVGWLLAGSSPGAKIINAPIYNVSLAYIRNPQVMYELNVNLMYTKIKYDPYRGHNDTLVGYSQTYIMFGIVRTFKTEIPNFMPYLSTCIGFTNSNIQMSNAAPSTTRLAAGLLGGVKVGLNKRMGLKFQLRIQAPLSGFGLGVGIGTGGPSVGIGSYSSTIQFDVSGGLFFRL